MVAVEGVVSPLRHVANVALNLLFPPACVGCGRLGAEFCADCAQAVDPSPLSICARCGSPQPMPADRCYRCQDDGYRAPLISRAAALHTSPLRDAIHAFKYQGQPQLASFLARYLVAVYAQPPWSDLAQPITAVVPVPLFEQRLRERGYNQSELLADHFCRASGLPMQPSWLARIRETRQQVGLGLGQRRANVAGAFAASASVANHRILLIDDLHTTGSTLRACAAAALDAGAAAVYALTLAQPAPRFAFPTSGSPLRQEEDFGDA
jgi:ComF family protein